MIIQTAVNGLSADPDRLLEAWETLRQSDPHVHGPDAAARLRVPEARLVASKVGLGATALEMQLRELLYSSASWGKLLIAIRSASGVVLNLLETVSSSYDPATRRIRISGPAHDIVLADTESGSCFLLEDRDAHGHTFSINWFDPRGDVVGRIFLMAKSGRERALPTLQRFARSSQIRTVEVDPCAPPLPVVRIGAGEEAGAFAANGKEDETVASEAAAAILALPSLSLAMVTFEGPGAACSHSGSFTKSSAGGLAVHASGPGAKLHLRPQEFRRSWVRASNPERIPDRHFMDGIGGALCIAPLTATSVRNPSTKPKGLT